MFEGHFNLMLLAARKYPNSCTFRLERTWSVLGSRLGPTVFTGDIADIHIGGAACA